MANCPDCSLATRDSAAVLYTHPTIKFTGPGDAMKKFLIATTAILALLSAAGCAGKAPYGKAPVVAKG